MNKPPSAAFCTFKEFMEIAKGIFYNQLADFLLVHAVALTGGILVSKAGWKVNYTRKINHFFVFFSPYLIKPFFPYEETQYTVIWLALVGIATLGIYWKPIREQIGIVGLMFTSFDRPEDKPYSLKWLFTQYLATYIVALPLWLLFREQKHTEAMPIIILINAIGDGLAEPVGVTWGKHKYKVRALFTKNEYHRTLEGSACVFLTAVAAVLVYGQHFTGLQMTVALVSLPVVATLAEAKAPHTWDSPFIFLACGINLSLIYLI